MSAVAVRRERQVAPPPAHHETREDDIAAMVIDGQIVMIDTADFYADGKVLCAVILWDSTICLRYPKLANERSYLGKRTGYFGNGEMTANGSVHLLGCQILGRVISQN